MRILHNRVAVRSGAARNLSARAKSDIHDQAAFVVLAEEDVHAVALDVHWHRSDPNRTVNHRFVKLWNNFEVINVDLSDEACF